ncbi:MAG: glucose 1-dehydrogenase [Firmicutes bacterium]|nr:glucose 1-dehydrogenase [Bacillota bacterium]
MSVLDAFRLDGKKAIVTGGGQGLGKAMATALAEAGADVAIADLNADSAAAVAKELEGLGRQSMAVQVDVSNEEQVKAMVAKVVEAWGTVDILINSAGINRRNKLIDLAVEDYDAIMDVNLRGTFLCCQEAGRIMVAKGSGSIINVSSMSAFIINKDRPVGAYCASKAGVNLLTKGFAAEWAKSGVRVNAIAPGYFKTPLNFPWMATEQGPEALSLTPMGRFAEPEEIGPLAVFLASPASSFITGHVVLIDGGYTIW